MKRLPLLCVMLLFLDACKDSGDGSATTVKKNTKKKSEITSDAELSANFKTKDYSLEEMQKMPLAELILYDYNLKSQNMNEDSELKEINAENELFCKELEKIAASCAGSKYITKYSVDSNLQCYGDESQANQTEASSEAKISVTVPASKQGKFVIVLNDLYQSTPFGPGTTAITFKKTKGSTSGRPPTFFQVFKAILKSADEGVALPPINSDFALSMAVNSKNVLNQSLLNTTGDPNIYGINLSDLSSGSGGKEACGRDPNQILELKNIVAIPFEREQAKKRLAAYGKQSEIADLSKIQDTAKMKKDLISSIMTANTAIEKRFSVLDSERSRNGALQAELSQNQNIGCKYEQVLKSLSITFQGKLIALQKLDKAQASPLLDPKGSGTSVSMFVELGQDYKTVISDVSGYLGTDGGNSATFIFSNLEKGIVGGIDRIFLKKTQVQFVNQPQSCNTMAGFAGNVIRALADPTCYDVKEKDVMFIDGITIVANGEEVFNQSGLNITLNRDTPAWQLKSPLQTFPEWGQLMQEQNCDITK